MPELTLEDDLVVVGRGFRPDERVAVLVKTIGSVQQVTVDQGGAFRLEIGPLGPGAGLWISATGDRGSRATLVLPRPSRLH